MEMNVDTNELIKNFEIYVKIKKTISESQNIALVGHISPDADAIASICTFYEYISQTTIHNPFIRLLIEDVNYELKDFNYFIHSDKVEFVDNLNDAIVDTDLIIFFDSSSLDRFTANPINLSDKNIIHIDHHVSESDIKTDLYLTPTKNIDYIFSSNSELLYVFFYNDNKLSFNKNFYETLTTGILTDTGFLSYINHTNSSVLTNLNDIINKGKLDLKEIGLRLKQKQIESIKLLGEFLQRFELNHDAKYGDYALVTLPKYISEKYSEEYRDEAFMLIKSYLESVIGATWSLYIREDLYSEGICRVSFRSVPIDGKYLNVAKLAEQFGGGGHKQASGATISAKNIDECLNIIKNTLSSSEPEFLII